jgi:hypothetical protein
VNVQKQHQRVLGYMLVCGVRLSFPGGVVMSPMSSCAISSGQNVERCGAELGLTVNLVDCVPAYEPL